jgi:hypothetical protein
LRNKKATVNGKTYKQDSSQFIIELYNQWLSNSDEGVKLKSERVSLDQMMRDFYKSSK